MVDILARNPKTWVEVMMVEELGLLPVDENPVYNALVTFLAFALFGVVPIIPYIVGHLANLDEGLEIVSTIMTACFMCVLGITKSMFTYARWYKSAFETLLVGIFAAGSSYLIGLAFEGINWSLSH